MKWRRWSQRTQEWRDNAREHIDGSAALRVSAIAIAAYLLLMLMLGFFWSREPGLFSVTEVTAKQIPHAAHPLPGSHFGATLDEIVVTLLDKSGGFINNDIAPPGMWLDNMPAWERGVLAQTRDAIRVLQIWGRQQPGGGEGEDLGRVEPRLNFSADSWMLPSSESQYREAARYLHNYLLRLQESGEQRAYFAADTENLNAWLVLISARLGDLSKRLSVCVKPHDNPALVSGEPSERETTPSNRIDNIFYEARGGTWALIHLLRAAEIDFAVPLQKNNAHAVLHRIILDLEATQEPIYSPMILNGSGFGMLANHSLVMASYIARANASLINLRNSIAQDPIQ
jgi:hypothetical protein